MPQLRTEELLEAADVRHRIITADCANPMEIDDGIVVDMVQDADKELYRVTIASTDTSELYGDPLVRGEAERKLEAAYTVNRGKVDYTPMIPRRMVIDTQLMQGTVRSALTASFIVGDGQPPTDLHVGFEPIYVNRNISYKGLDLLCQRTKEGRNIARAAGYTIQHLGFVPEADEDKPHEQHVTGADLLGDYKMLSDALRWKRGARVVSAFMIAKNHLVGTLLANEGLPTINRLHNPEDTRFDDFLPSNVAYYSIVPGPHKGLRLSNICRVTSSLRRLEDFTMSNILKKWHLGLPLTDDDYAGLERTTKLLNNKIIHKSGNLAWLLEAGLLDESITAMSGTFERGAQVLQFPQRVENDEAAVVNG